MPVASRKWWVLAFFAVIVAFLLYRSRGLLHLNQFSGVKLWDVLRGANVLYFLAAVLLIYVCYFLRAVRWSNFQKYVGDSRIVPIFNLTVAGFSAVFLLGRVGEPVRPLLISRRGKVPLADTFGIYALERMFDTGFSVVVLASWFLIVTVQKFLNPYSIPSPLENARKTAGTVLTLLVIGILVLLVYVRSHGGPMLERRMQTWLAAHGWRASFARIVLGVARGVTTIRNWRDLTYALALSAVHWFLIILVYYLAAKGFGGTLATLRFQDAMLILALTLVGSVFQLPGIGGGPQAVMIGAYTKLFGVPSEAAVAAAMVLYLITFAASTIAGVPILIKEGWSIGQLKSMSEHEAEEIDAEIIEHPAKPL
ncbi:MAG TPA: lysylphosphatidylglycerol synthase transmembrane domain-containing protein [Candidatus Limnocylindrales bacterium]|nr:lysylphosphatidylglycerol synthase transmembrane domain-containing protein [Candidatus Limnocylindrales bacterium]